MTCLNFEYHFWSGYYYTSCLIFYVLLILITMVRIDPIYFILAELNDTTAAGLNGFAMLQKFSSGYDQKELATKLEKAMQYIKTKYQSHLTQDSLIAAHTTGLALSDKNNELLISNTETTDEVCRNCFNLCKSLDDIGELIKKYSCGDGIAFDIENAIQSVKHYVKHEMWDAQQWKAKNWCYQQLSETCAFWLKDFSQKILPMDYREGQKECFGKKGMSLHVDVFFYKNTNKDVVKFTYFTVVERCDQGLVDVLSISDVVLEEFTQDVPRVNMLFWKSDNANCYHGNFAAEGLYHLCKQHGIQLSRYD